ncbi:site-specific integrase [Vermiculatibacterium agrestimuris]|uniref:site-specific integrase n=1 Tax=Vermiculatibacterium agrestimuris TaxID=2941519 RepID=UPI002041E5C1|nr:site-specific integrase [Vermiculatibacterium agrestimuris]
MKVPKARKLPSGKWFIQLRLGGESIPVSARTEKECTRQAQLIKSEYLAGKRAPAAPDEEEPEKLPTLAEAIESYMESRSNILSPATIRGYEGIKRNRFKGLMDRSLSDITEDDYMAACNAEARLCGAKTLKNAWGLVKSVVKAEAGITMPEIPLPQVVPNARDFLDADDIPKFIAAVHGSKYEIPFLLALSSLRRSEIMALRWENVDLPHRRIKVKGAAVPDKNHKLVQKAENKNRSSTRIIPILIDELHAALAAAEQPSGPVVTCGPDAIRRALHKICEANKLPSVTLHGLRHSFASLAYHLKVPEQITMEIGGWSDNQTMRKIYTHIAQSDIKRYEKAFEGFFKKNANKNANGDSTSL